MNKACQGLLIQKEPPVLALHNSLWKVVQNSFKKRTGLILLISPLNLTYDARGLLSRVRISNAVIQSKRVASQRRHLFG